jgi:hypothetical protein
LACHQLLGTKRTALDARIWRGCWLMSRDSPFWILRMAAAFHSTGATSDVLRGYLRAEMIAPLPLAVHYSRAGRVETVSGDAGGSGPW